MEEVWKAEKAALQGTQHIKEELEKAQLQLEAANRSGDLAKMSELQYGKIPELQKKLQQANKSPKETRLLRNKVTAEEIAEIVSRWTRIPVARMLEGERAKLLRMEDELHKYVV